MRHFNGKLKLNLGRLAAAAAVFGVSGLVAAYCLGYYDLAFLDRSSVFGDLRDEPSQSDKDSPLFNFETEGKDPSRPDETDSSGVGSKDDSSPSDSHENSSLVNQRELSSVLRIADTSLLADARISIPAVSELTDYSPTTKSYLSSGMTLAKMQFSFKLPELFTLRVRESQQLSYVVPAEYAPYVAEYSTVYEKRPAVELYMGMILIDTGTSTVIVDANGSPLCSFDDSVYKPAYTRDKDGRPLFYKQTETGRKIYYFLSADGKNFTVSDYNDKTDSRGLYFDYPASYGKTDGIIYREYDKEEKKWAYRTPYSDVTEPEFAEAYDFVDGFACVTAPSEENNGGMYFINQYGWRIQETFVAYLSELDRYSIWDYALPASRGIENIGFFYFDHGLTRVRYQIIDYYNWEKDRVRVVSDEDKLIRTDGSVYELPRGYTLKGYSDGMILLEKDGLFGFMDYTGGWIAEPCYASATPFVDGLAVLETADGRFGMIDTKGNIVLPFTYDYISMASSGLVAVYREENGWTILKLMEKK